tara:strand:+ start:2206 stop:3075 length:870 start_codon:yes stop_codon:yes gene_type:complete
MDFDIANYNLDDLLGLFELPYNFSQEDLKKARNVVVKVHPDKSGLDKEYFIFFKKAYDLLVQLHGFRSKTESNDTLKKQTYTVERDEEKEQLLSKIKGKKNFHKWFNEMFEKTVNPKTLRQGHGDWLKSDSDIDTRETTLMGMGQAFERKKTEVKSLVLHQGVKEINGEGGVGSLLDDSEIESYEDTKLFSKMRYDDVRQAHTNTVVPVTHDDFLQRPQYNSISQLQSAREGQNVTPLSDKQSQKYLAQKEQMENGLGVRRAYNLLRADEKAKQSTEEWWASLKQIEDR